MNKQQKVFYRLFSEHGTGDAKVTISPKEVSLMLYITMNDLGKPLPDPTDAQVSDLAGKGFYNIKPSDIWPLSEITEDDCFSQLEGCGITNVSDVSFLYLKNLCELYRRRMKYCHILESQPFPIREQIAPRSLLEYGNCSDNLLADWLEWRKWLFDIDNRSAQETGYIFEPILASCLGGEPVSARFSPVRRIDDNGEVTQSGRQIDCYIAERKEVYELKMRVSIAASGQGRFGEEMSFPFEAHKAGLTPILVVFDDTDSVLLDKLKRQYKAYGGRYFIGKKAWEMLEQQAGKEMGIFIRKYIYPPIDSVGKHIDSNPADIQISNHDGVIRVKGRGKEYTIKRNGI